MTRLVWRSGREVRPPRLLFVTAQAAFFVSHRLALASAAHAAGFDVQVATPPGPRQEEILDAGLPWHEISLRRQPGAGDLVSLAGLVRLYRRLRPTLVHHVALKPVLLGTASARISGVPVVINAITGLGYSFEGRRAESLLSRLMQRAFDLALAHPGGHTIFQNAEDRELFVRRGWASPSAAWLVAGAGVDTDLYFPDHAMAENPHVVLFVSRLLQSKGVADFVAAADILKRTHPGTRFVVVGTADGDNRDSISARELAAWQQEGVVEFMGHRSDMPELLRSATVFALPTYYREGVPKALIEAAATGLACVTTDAPGCRDVVIPNETGLLVPPRTPLALAEAIGRLLDDPALARQLGEHARERAVARFSLVRIVEQTLAIYQIALEAQGLTTARSARARTAPAPRATQHSPT